MPYLPSLGREIGHEGSSLSKALNALSEKLDALKRPVITAIDVYTAIDVLHQPENRDGLYLRTDVATTKKYETLAAGLNSVPGFLATPRPGVWRVTRYSTSSADEMICLADPFTYVSHLSAMRIWQLTNRVPNKVSFSRLHRTLIKPTLQRNWPDQWPQPILPAQPETLGRFGDVNLTPSITIAETKHPASTVELGGSHVRVTSQAATFLDMLASPARCGGMAHILEIFDTLFLERPGPIRETFITLVDTIGSPIVKVRAGHILTERLGLKDPQVESWTQFAARGGSRKLDPERPYASVFSERWMLSLNVE